MLALPLLKDKRPCRRITGKAGNAGKSPDSLASPKNLKTVKKIEAIIKPYKLEEVRDALGEIGVTGMTVTEVRGFGRQKGQTELFRGNEYEVQFVPKLQIEVVVADENAREAVEAVVRGARTGKIGDGKVFVATVDHAVRIRTEETGDAAV
jgi:nitrogen regulatory protein P-II 1